VIAYGVVLSLVVVGAAVWFARRGDENAPELSWINDFIALVIAGIALVMIWVGVFIARIGRAGKERPSRRDETL
jgi:hypothetical protein